MIHPFRGARPGPLPAALGSTLLACFFLCGCVTEPITGRSRLASILGEKEVNEMGIQGYKQMLAEAKVSGDSRQVAMVETAGRRIAAVTDQLMAEEGRELYQWEFKVVDDPKTINAFALPGGKVAFYSGILPLCGSETGVAVVMGHEIAHAFAQHGRFRMSQHVLATYTLEAIDVALGGEEASDASKLALAALGVGYQIGVELPFSRQDESAADKIGLILMARAGYDPREAAAFWQRMHAAGGGGPPQFLSTHPSHETRIAQINAWLPEALAEYEKAKGKSVSFRK